MAYPTQINQNILDHFRNQRYDPLSPTSAQYVDPATGQQYFGRYDAVGNGEGNNPTYNLTGYSVGNYENSRGGKVGVYDTSGKYTGKNEDWKADDWNYDGLVMAATGAFIGGFAAMAGGGLGAASGATQAGETLSKAALDGTNVFGANSAANALDISSLVNAAPGIESANAVGNIAQDLGYFPPGDAYDPSTMPTESDVPVDPANPAAPPPGTNPTTTPPATNPTTTPPPPGTNPSTTIPKIPPIPTPGGGGGGNTNTGGTGGFDLNTLLSLATGLYGMNQQEHSSQAMIDYLKQRQTMNDDMYKQGSPEFNALWDEMSRKDAAAGRNSQYGPRSVDLAARVAQLKMNANTQMTTGIGNFMANALNQKGNAGANLTSLLPQIFGSGGTQGMDLNTILTKIGDYFKNGGTLDTGTGGGTTNVDPNTVDTSPDNIDAGGGYNPATGGTAYDPQKATAGGEPAPAGNTGFVPAAQGGSPVPAPAQSPQNAPLPGTAYTGNSPLANAAANAGMGTTSTGTQGLAQLMQNGMTNGNLSDSTTQNYLNSTGYKDNAANALNVGAAQQQVAANPNQYADILNHQNTLIANSTPGLANTIRMIQKKPQAAPTGTSMGDFMQHQLNLTNATDSWLRPKG